MPAILDAKDGGQVIVVAAGSPTSGIPYSWAASEHQAGVCLIEEDSEDAVRTIAESIAAVKGSADVIVVSLHWGGNWGYAVPAERQTFAHRLIDEAGADIIHGHSSHHVRGIEVYHGKLILYGCGNFLDDYEGISGYETFRPDLSLMYFASVDDKTGRLLALQMVPMQIRHFRLIVQDMTMQFGCAIHWRVRDIISNRHPIA